MELEITDKTDFFVIKNLKQADFHQFGSGKFIGALCFG